MPHTWWVSAVPAAPDGPTSTIYTVTADRPAWGLLAGDYLVHRPDHPTRPLVLHRTLDPDLLLALTHSDAVVPAWGAGDGPSAPRRPPARVLAWPSPPNRRARGR